MHPVHELFQYSHLKKTVVDRFSSRKDKTLQNNFRLHGPKRDRIPGLRYIVPPPGIMHKQS